MKRILGQSILWVLFLAISYSLFFIFHFAMELNWHWAGFAVAVCWTIAFIIIRLLAYAVSIFEGRKK